MTVNTNSDRTAGRARRRKVAAALAGGLVLGVGTMATLASWNDSPAAAATYSAGQFAPATAR
ncbi:MAG: SipW-dependent-type signal peptide-containing protein [Propionicimonas sp.]